MNHVCGICGVALAPTGKRGHPWYCSKECRRLGRKRKKKLASQRTYPKAAAKNAMRREALRVKLRPPEPACPRCGAKGRERCRTRSGKLPQRIYAHAGRFTANRVALASDAQRLNINNPWKRLPPLPPRTQETRIP